jgi:hypothetical protein
MEMMGKSLVKTIYKSTKKDTAPTVMDTSTHVGAYKPRS